jgi:hypothetical protein
MNSFPEIILIIVILLGVAGPMGFMRYKLFIRFIRAQESIAESLNKLVEIQTKRR